MKTKFKISYCPYYAIVAVIVAGIMLAPFLLHDTYAQKGKAELLPANKMKFALMTYTFARQDWKKDGNFDLVKMCEVGRELGVEGVDIVSHSFSPLNPDSIRKVLEAHGQKVVCYTFFPKLNKPTKAERAEGIEEVKKAIEIAKLLGTNTIMIHTPGDSKMSEEECRVNWIHGLQEAIELTNAAGITLTIESIRHSPLSTSAEMLRVVREVPGIKLVFDTGNVYASGEDPLDFYKACRNYIVHAHFKDGRWYDKTNTDGTTSRDFSNELIGEGDINIAECAKAMVKDGYSGYVDIEYESNKYTPDVANQKAIEYINNILKSHTPYKGVDEKTMSKLGWKVAIQCWTYNQHTFFDTLDSIKSLGVGYVEMLSYQTVSKDIPQKSGPDMDKECLKKVKAKLKETGISAVAVWVDPFPNNEEAIRKLFAWAKELGIETVTTEPDPNDTATLELAAKLCNEYKINIAVHNHPRKTNNDNYKLWDPNFTLGVVKPYFPQIGMCTDVGHWYRSGLVSLDCLKKVNGYINSVHFKDLNLNKQDVPIGTGVLNASELLAELQRQAFKGVLTLEYESWGINQHAEILKSIEFLNNECKKLIK
jgi:sugar phosphate isomerase/epimerase